jgi:ankyrin repeat protein
VSSSPEDPAPEDPAIEDPAPEDPAIDDDPELIEFATRLFNLARAGDTAALASYLDAGVPVNLANGTGDSLLMLAAYHGHAATVRALITRGADPGRANDRGQTPLAGAVFKRERKVVRTLLDHGADPDAGRPSAAETARMFGNEEFLAWFGEAGEDRG